jgi:hypothetical protein
MPRFFYVYVLVSKTDETIRYTGSLATFKRASPNTTREAVSTLQNTVRGISKSPSPSGLNEKREHSKNISRADRAANSLAVIFNPSLAAQRRAGLSRRLVAPELVMKAEALAKADLCLATSMWLSYDSASR